MTQFSATANWQSRVGQTRRHLYRCFKASDSGCIWVSRHSECKLILTTVPHSFLRVVDCFAAYKRGLLIQVSTAAYSSLKTLKALQFSWIFRVCLLRLINDHFFSTIKITIQIMDLPCFISSRNGILILISNFGYR
jgi:hypothetical protein